MWPDLGLRRGRIPGSYGLLGRATTKVANLTARIGAIALILPSSRWQRVVITALLVLPLVLIVALSAPAWLMWPFLGEPRREAVLRFLSNLIDWIKAIAGSAELRPVADSALRRQARLGDGT